MTVCRLVACRPNWAVLWEVRGYVSNLVFFLIVAHLYPMFSGRRPLYCQISPLLTNGRATPRLHQACWDVAQLLVSPHGVRFYREVVAVVTSDVTHRQISFRQLVVASPMTVELEIAPRSSTVHQIGYSAKFASFRTHGIYV